MSVTTRSNTPSGNQRSGEAIAIVPVKPAGPTPTTVIGVALTVMVLPTYFGSAPARRQKPSDTIATGIAAPGRSSSIENARPAASGTPSVAK